MMRYLLGVIFSLCLLACSNNKTTTQNVSRYYDDGRSKPIVAISSIIDSTSYDLPWSLSEELTHLVKQNLSSNKNIFLSSTEDIDLCLSNSDNPFDLSVDWMQDRFEPNEFVVFLELIQHKEQQKTSVTNLDMSMRIRIIDMRSKKPKIILQECLNNNFYVAKGSTKANYQNIHWGSEEYDNSRMGMAHKQLAQEIASRISDYIALAKSR